MRELTRLAVMFRRPIAEVLAWPAQHVELILAFLRVEPSPEDRIEIAVASLAAQHYNRTRGKDEQARGTADYLPFATAWSDAPIGASDLDAQLAQTLNRYPKE